MAKGLAYRIFAGWRGLGVFWVLVLLLLGGGGLWLDRLGPAEPQERLAEAASTPAPPAPEPPASASAAPPVTTPPQVAETPAPPAAAPEPATAAAPAATPAEPPPATRPDAAPPTAEASALTPVAPAPPPLDVPVATPEFPTARPIAAPDAALLEQGRFGPLPRVGNDGRTSIRAYAGQFERQDARPRIGIIVADIGISNAQTEDAIRRLPPAVTFAISPYAPRAAQVAERLRAKGVETLIGLPLEPAGYPLNDPGNRALLTGRSAPENMANLEWILSRFPGYVGAIGVVGGMRGERFAAMEQSYLALQESLRNRGLLYVDARPNAAAPARAWGRSVDVILDEPATRAEIERRLGELEAIAKARGSALGLAHAATPVVVDRLVAWAVGIEERRMVLAPVTALIRRPPETSEARTQ
ncbi:MAG: divergent polysaccharide deacetylase family protein [Roseomonas sp.]|nr:divergent polysaccharide deacetylase family protein [Roseomonas sp.]MCA3329019.1 divergent polysaccharide deacetylase family protein [Roseomonas sp.]MCA3330219.1 divergent polysaccharide deacetylase family protein [Roseomonas sp.]MCA3333881.1 divergent polysaccharide deacetylase family protein [Roseomonas sp.]MCA3353195.1 divergent polysaccharide deacetylase family protein [Roseomonas sp.]